MRHPALVALIAIASAAALQSPAHAKTWDETWQVGANPVVRVITNDAHVRIHIGPAGKVQAHVLHDIKKWGWAGGDGPTSVTFDHQNDVITIEARTHGNYFVIGGIAEKFEVDVTLPESSTLDVRSGDGAIDIPALRGKLNAEAGDGHIRVIGAKGDVTLSTGDGAIDATELDGSLSARTRDGHLNVSGRFDALDLRSGDGRIDATALTGSQPARDWSVESGDGSLALRIPHRIRTLLDARTRDGGLHVDLPIGVRASDVHHELVGQINGGGPTLRVRTGDGSARIGVSD